MTDKTANDVRTELRQYISPRRAAEAPRYFKAGPGGYAEGDKFLGVSVPDTRVAIKQYRDLPLAEVKQLLQSQWHEERLAALFILVYQFTHGDVGVRRKIYELYLQHADRINNWDLVDSSAPYIVGGYLVDKPERVAVLEKLARSNLLWERRIAMLATFTFIRQEGRPDEALIVAELLLHDTHDLIHKAVGWMLREIGICVDHSVLHAFLDQYAATMPRVMLRYALERCQAKDRQYYMSKKGAK